MSDTDVECRDCGHASPPSEAPAALDGTEETTR